MKDMKGHLKSIEDTYMNDKKIISLYFISVASTLSGIHPQTIRTYEEKGLVKPYRTKGGTRRYSQEDVDKLIQIANLSQRGIKLEGIKIIYEMRDKIEEMQEKIDFLQEEISSEKSARAKKENEIHKSYKNEIVKKSNKDLRKKL